MQFIVPMNLQVIHLFDKAHDADLIFQILEGLRPQILPSMPDDYAQMMQKCWDVDPSKRPTIKELLKFADNRLKKIYDNKNSEIDFVKDNISGDNSNSLRIHKSHPSAYHTSRILNDEIAKSKILKSNDGLFEWS